MAGKGSTIREGFDHKKFATNYEKIDFTKKEIDHKIIKKKNKYTIKY